MSEILLGIVLFSAIVVALALLVLAAHAFLMPTGKLTIIVNKHRSIEALAGQKLLTVLLDAGISIPSTCAGIGSCGLCRVRVPLDEDAPTSLEKARISRRDVRTGTRLACQVTVRDAMEVEVPESLMNVGEFECTVVRERFVSPLLRELELALPTGQPFDFTPGAYVQITAPAYRMTFSDIQFPGPYAEALEVLGVPSLTARNDVEATRAYSIANTPADTGKIVLLIRLALPPPNHADAPPGVVSSYLFGVSSGDKLTVSGPYSAFGALQSDREMVFIGGGVGMAPLRAIICDQLKNGSTKRKMSFWYGARSRADLLYEEDFEALAAKHENFTWTPALSDPGPNDAWDGPTGFIHTVVLEQFLEQHPAPERCEYYLCGPPLMMQAVLNVLEDCGADEELIFFDDFGS